VGRHGGAPAVSRAADAPGEIENGLQKTTGNGKKAADARELQAATSAVSDDVGFRRSFSISPVKAIQGRAASGSRLKLAPMREDVLKCPAPHYLTYRRFPMTCWTRNVD
jgi:hypothetical protein